MTSNWERNGYDLMGFLQHLLPLILLSAEGKTISKQRMIKTTQKSSMGFFSFFLVHSLHINHSSPKDTRWQHCIKMQGVTNRSALKTCLLLAVSGREEHVSISSKILHQLMFFFLVLSKTSVSPF